MGNSTMSAEVGIFLIILLLIDVILIVAVLRMNMRYKRLSSKYKMFMKGEDGTSIERALDKKVAKIERYAKNIGTVDDQIKAIRDIIGKSVHKYGIVKYDAFDDVGGKLSFVLALLDDSDSGFVLNAVHSKENCFLYIKEIVKGESYIMLSNEEIEALRIAKRYGTEEELTV